MLPKKNRASAKEVELIFKKGASLASPNLAFKYYKNGGRAAKISFIAPKNIARLAVERNALRRLGYKALGKYLDLSPAGIVGAFVFKKYQDDILILENEIKNIFDKFR